MIANYTFSRYKDTYILSNSDGASLSFVLTKKINCDEDISSPVSEGNIAGHSSLTLPIIFDGEYILVLTRGSDTITLNISNYLTLQKALLFNLRQVLCGYSSCPDCEIQGLDDCVQYQGIFSQLISYQYLISPSLNTNAYCSKGNIFDAYFHQAMELYRCTISKDLYNQLIEESLSGRIKDSKELVIYIAAIYYTAFYFYERLIAADTDEEFYVDAKFYWPQVQICIKRLGIDINALKAIFIDIITSNNVAPTVGNVDLSLDNNNDGLQTYIFQTSDFTNDFHDDNGDSPNIVKLANNPINGSLYFNGSHIINAEGYTFSIADVGLLEYRFTPPIGGNNDILFFQINDNNPTPIYSDMAVISIAVGAYINLPPSSVGNLSLTLLNRVTRVFTLADFTTTTTPAYHDPEGDGVYQLRIDSLPSLGTLKVSGTPATIGQIVPVSVITGGGFEYDAPDQDASASVTFNYSLADTGSHQFTS